MGKIERIYRMRRGFLFAVFICSLLFLGAFCFPLQIASWVAGKPMMNLGESVFRRVFLVGAALLGVILLLLLLRYLLFRIATRKEPVLRSAVDDERVRTGWMHSYRAAVLTIIGIHLVDYAPFMILGVHPVWLSLSAGLAVLFGAAIFHTREGAHEPA